MSDDLTPQDSAALIERRASPFQNYAQRDYVTYSFLDSFPLAEYGSLLSNPLYANATTSGAFNSCAAPPKCAIGDAGNHLAPASEFLSQVASRFERLLDGQALGQVRGLTAAFQFPPDPGGAFHHLLA